MRFKIIFEMHTGMTHVLSFGSLICIVFSVHFKYVLVVLAVYIAASSIEIEVVDALYFVFRVAVGH